MKRRLLVAAGAALLAACGNTIAPAATGQFAAPSGLAVTSAGDRDLLFIANQGHDNLRALQLCTTDGGVLPDGGPDTCPAQANLQFVPAPIRVFPATIEVSDRPRRLAGVRLSRPDGSSTGVVLAVGADDQLRLVDARRVLETANHLSFDGGVPAPADAGTDIQPASLQLDSPGVDVVAENAVDVNGYEVGAPAGQAATAFVATVPQGAIKAELLMLQVGVDARGVGTTPVVTGKCALDPVVPRKLAVVPGGGDRVYIADGAGDGIVSVTKASIPPPSGSLAPCTFARISAGGRATRSVAISPQWTEAVPTSSAADAGTIATPHPAGELALMVLEPKPVATPGSDLDPGGVLIARTADKNIVPIPPSSVFDQTLLLQPMEPISTPGLPREATFLRSNPQSQGCPNASCTAVYVGAPADKPTAYFNLLASVTSTDGAAYFVDVLKRRFVNSSYYDSAVTQAPTLSAAVNLVPSSSDPVPPSLVFLDATSSADAGADAGTLPDGGTPVYHPLNGWYTPGVTHSANWRVIWHAPFPGLETRSGAISTSGSGTILLKFNSLDLTPWVSDPVLKLGVGDTVSFGAYTVPSGAPSSCSNLVANESPSRFDLRILSLPAPDTLELAPLPPSTTVRPFDLSNCPTGLQVVAAVHAGGAHPWLVYDGPVLRGRAKAGERFIATERRFDYPLDYASPTATTDDNVAVAFLLSGDDPLVPNTFFSFSVQSNLSRQFFRDSSLPQGYATAVLGYSSPHFPQLVFSAVTGANEVVQADTTILGYDPILGIVSYK